MGRNREVFYLGVAVEIELVCIDALLFVIVCGEKVERKSFKHKPIVIEVPAEAWSSPPHPAKNETTLCLSDDACRG